MKKEILRGKAKVIVIYKKGDKKAKTIIDGVEESCKKVERFFNIVLKKNVTIRLVYSRKEFDKFSGEKTEIWAVGIALGKGEDIIIFSPSAIAKHSDKDKDYPLDKTICHEITHMYIRQAGFTPWWLDEGLAYILADQSFLKHSKGNYEKLSKSGKMFSYTQENYNFCMNNYGYGLSLYITTEALKNLGKKKLVSLIKNNCKRGDYNEFFEKEVGTSPKDYIAKLMTK